MNFSTTSHDKIQFSACKNCKQFTKFQILPTGGNRNARMHALSAG